MTQAFACLLAVGCYSSKASLPANHPSKTWLVVKEPINETSKNSIPKPQTWSGIKKPQTFWPKPSRKKVKILIPQAGQTKKTASLFNNLDLSEVGNFYGLVIGNNDYQSLPKLDTAQADAMAIGNLLSERYHFQVNVLLDVTRGDIIQSLDEYRMKLSEKDNLLIYFAGHGWVDKGSERGYWLPINAEKDNRTNWLSNADITDSVKAINAKRVLVVVDSCYSGTLTRGLERGVRIPTLKSKRFGIMLGLRSRTVLTSGGLEPVLDGGGNGHSVFANALLLALKQNNEVIDATELFYRIRRQVSLDAEQSPQYSNIRLAGHEVGGDFIFLPQ